MANKNWKIFMFEIIRLAHSYLNFSWCKSGFCNFLQVKNGKNVFHSIFHLHFKKSTLNSNWYYASLWKTKIGMCMPFGSKSYTVWYKLLNVENVGFSLSQSQWVIIKTNLYLYSIELFEKTIFRRCISSMFTKVQST